MSDNSIPDADRDDSYSAGDADVDWSNVDELAAQIAAINAITDAARRLAAAKRWVVELDA